ncbi:hypothetical protein DPSP01_001644 [Paraphaeosphaeria sporulosa]
MSSRKAAAVSPYPSNPKPHKSRPGGSSGRIGSPSESQDPPVKKRADEDWIRSLDENLKLLDEAGVVLVVGMGNDFIGNMPTTNNIDG